MGKRGRGKRVAPERFKNVNNSGSNKKTKDEFLLERDIDDEIDAFHKQRDFVPMYVNEYAGDSDSDDDDVVPVFDHKDLNGEEDDDDEEDYYDPALAKRNASPVRELDETQEPAAVDKKSLPSETVVEKETRIKGKHEKHQDEARLGHQSKEMLKFRASLEYKLRHKGILGSAKSNSDKTQNQRRQKVNGQLETFDDYNDDLVDDQSNGTTKPLQTKRLSELVTSTRANKPKVASGEDDLVDRGDIGERRRMHELRVLRKAGIESEDGPPGDELGSEDDAMEEDEFYQQVKKQKIEKLASKQKKSSRDDGKRYVPQETVDGKRHISYQMEKNRGLTRSRKKLTKNPRMKYKLNYEKAVVARKGQVRDIKKPTGPYGGETSGINAGISRSIRLKG